MSIFPKRTIQGKSVTIHWGIALETEKNIPQFPLVRLGVKAPDGSITSLCNRHIMLLPDHSSENKEENIIQTHLPKNVPLLILADYLSGKRKREKLVEMLKHIQTSRHYYFQYPIPDNALPGKYELVSEIYLEGEYYPSRTAEEDFFYVDKLKLERENGKIQIQNLSQEPCPVKTVSVSELDTISEVHIIQPLESLYLEDKTEVQYLLYSEEREVVSLSENKSKKMMRNQTLQNFEKIENDALKIYVLFPEDEDAYILEGNYAKIWNLAEGTIDENTLKEIDHEAFVSMMEAQLLQEYDLEK
nr:hypothetical protein [uncultured Chryseobacterium sp.]